MGEGAGTDVRSVDGAAVEGLRTAMRGTVVAKGDEGYDAARQIYNAMIQKYPAVIAGTFASEFT